MKRIPKDLADKMVEDVLTEISKHPFATSQFAQDSLSIMNDNIDNSIFTGILMSKAKPSFFDKNEINMKSTIITSLQGVLMHYKDRPEDFNFNSDLAKEFCVIDTDKCSNSTKLDFALNQFVNAFYEYERLENKYPDLMKIM
jgi:hypothetical protein